eukprot:SM000299S10832  [mRNA]  locus=s299:118263:119724:+ [translate_table: standard]
MHAGKTGMHPPRKRKKTPVWGPTASQSQALKGLLAVKAAFANGHARGPLSTWVGANPCSGAWTGVTCEAGTPVGASGTELLVSGLDLNGFGLQGPLPGAALLQLKDLGFLHASHNRLTGALPNLSTLSRLAELDLSSNFFQGPIPASLASLPALRYLDLRYNLLTGGIPPALCAAQLDVLAVNQNSLGAALPANLGSSPVSLAVLGNNRLSGVIPPSISSMAATLVELYLTGAGLSGPLDPGLGALVSSQVLDLSANSLTGDLPSVAKLSNLVRLNIASNQLDGNITNSDVFHLPRLQSLVYSQNRFTGLPPADTSVPFIDGSACDSGAANGTFVTVDQVYRIGNLTCHHFVIQAPSPPPPRAPGSPPDSSRT